MASLAEIAPLPLLLDSLLASSWTWLALCLATVATLLRALSRLPFGRRPPDALLAPPPSLLLAETKQMAADLPLPLRKSHKLRASCKSTPSLQGLPLFFGNVEFSVSPLRRTASTSELRADQLAALGRASCNNESCTPVLAAAAGSRLGFVVKTQERWSGAPLHDCATKVSGEPLPSLDCGPEVARSPSALRLSFEMQFGWRRLLDIKFGLQWQVQTRALSSQPACAVKVWSIHDSSLLELLRVDRRLAVALDVDVGDGLACIADSSGYISLWDICTQACISRMFANAKRFSLLCCRSNSNSILSASCDAVQLWDFRFPTSLVPICDWTAASDGGHSVNVHCETNTLNIYPVKDVCLLYDLRMARGDHVKNSMQALPSGSIVRIETKPYSASWEKLYCEDEELWDEPGWTLIDTPERSTASFTSKCVTLMRSLSSSGR